MIRFAHTMFFASLLLSAARADVANDSFYAAEAGPAGDRESQIRDQHIASGTGLIGLEQAFHEEVVSQLGQDFENAAPSEIEVLKAANETLTQRVVDLEARLLAIEREVQSLKKSRLPTGE